MRSLHGDLWFDRAGVLRIGDQKRCVSEARQRLIRENRADTHDRIVAELGFGFWTGMMARPYERSVWQTQIARDFRLAPRPIRNRSNIASRLNDIRALRNRASHHESIWQRPRLETEHRNVIQTLGWVSPSVAATIAIVDRFPSLLKAGPTVYRDQVDALCTTWSAP